MNMSQRNALSLASSLMGIVACLCIFLLPSGVMWATYAKMSACLVAAGMFFTVLRSRKPLQ